MRILYLSHHWTNNSHHSDHSGFQRIVAFAAELHEVTLVTWGKEASDYREGRIRVITVTGPRKDFLFSKRIAISRKGRQIAGEFDAVHSLYSDCTFSLAPDSFTVTFHVLPAVIRYRSVKQRIFLFLKYNLLQKRAMRRAKHIAVVFKKPPVRHSRKIQTKGLLYSARRGYKVLGSRACVRTDLFPRQGLHSLCGFTWTGQETAFGVYNRKPFTAIYIRRIEKEIRTISQCPLPVRGDG